MIARAPTLTAAQRADLAAEEARPLTPAAFEARVAAPWTPEEVEDFTALVRWFRTRYPTAGERLAAMRRRMDALRRIGASSSE